MLARYVQKGDSIDYRPAVDIAAGDVIVIADLIGVARLDIEANTLGSLAVVGVFDVAKADGMIPAGSTVYWDAGAKKATVVSGSNHYLGKAILAADAEAETVRVSPHSARWVSSPRSNGAAGRSGGVAERSEGKVPVRSNRLSEKGQNAGCNDGDRGADALPGGK